MVCALVAGRVEGVGAQYGALSATVDKAAHPTWVGDRAVKLGLLGSFCAAQGITGLIESAKYGGVHISNSADDYHVYRFAQDVAWIGTGWFAYAETRQEGKPWWAKACRVVGAACYARNAYEWTYRWNRTGSPFNYSDEYSSNRKAIVLVKWDGDRGKLVDFYIDGTGKQGALIDAGFILVGFVLNRAGDRR